MENLILPVCILLFIALVLFSMRKQLSAMFRGELFNDPKMRELPDRDKRESKDEPPRDVP